MEQIESYTDVRTLQASLDDAGIELEERADQDSTGAAHVTLIDPDGHPILIDQFF